MKIKLVSGQSRSKNDCSPEENTKSGIVLPGSAKENPQVKPRHKAVGPGTEEVKLQVSRR